MYSALVIETMNGSSGSSSSKNSNGCGDGWIYVLCGNISDVIARIITMCCGFRFCSFPLTHTRTQFVWKLYMIHICDIQYPYVFIYIISINAGYNRNVERKYRKKLLTQIETMRMKMYEFKCLHSENTWSKIGIYNLW